MPGEDFGGTDVCAPKTTRFYPFAFSFVLFFLAEPFAADSIPKSLRRQAWREAGEVWNDSRLTIVRSPPTDFFAAPSQATTTGREGNHGSDTTLPRIYQNKISHEISDEIPKFTESIIHRNKRKEENDADEPVKGDVSRKISAKEEKDERTKKEKNDKKSAEKKKNEKNTERRKSNDGEKSRQKKDETNSKQSAKEERDGSRGKGGHIENNPDNKKNPGEKTEKGDQYPDMLSQNKLTIAKRETKEKRKKSKEKRKKSKASKAQEDCENGNTKSAPEKGPKYKDSDSKVDQAKKLPPDERPRHSTLVPTASLTISPTNFPSIPVAPAGLSIHSPTPPPSSKPSLATGIPTVVSRITTTPSTTPVILYTSEVPTTSIFFSPSDEGLATLSPSGEFPPQPSVITQTTKTPSRSFQIESKTIGPTSKDSETASSTYSHGSSFIPTGASMRTPTVRPTERPLTAPTNQLSDAPHEKLEDINSFSLELSIATIEVLEQGLMEFGRLRPLMAEEPTGGNDSKSHLLAAVLASLAKLIKKELGYSVFQIRRSRRLNDLVNRTEKNWDSSAVILDPKQDKIESSAVAVVGPDIDESLAWTTFQITYDIVINATFDNIFNASSEIAGIKIAANVHGAIKGSIRNGTLLKILQSFNRQIVAVSKVGGEAVASMNLVAKEGLIPALVSTPAKGEMIKGYLPLSPKPFDVLRIAGVLLFLSTLACTTLLIQESVRRHRKRLKERHGRLRARLRNEREVNKFLDDTRGCSGHNDMLRWDDGTLSDCRDRSESDRGIGRMFIEGGPFGLADRSEIYSSSSQSLDESDIYVRTPSTGSEQCRFSIKSAVYT